MQSNNKFIIPATSDTLRVQRLLHSSLTNQPPAGLHNLLFLLEVFEDLIEQSVDKYAAFLGAVQFGNFKVFVNGNPGGNGRENSTASVIAISRIRKSIKAMRSTSQFSVNDSTSLP